MSAQIETVPSVDAARRAGRRLKVLVISPSLPYPVDWGFATRVFYLIRALAGSADVTLLCYASGLTEEAERNLKAYCQGVDIVSPSSPRGGLRKRWRQLASVASPSSYQSQVFRSREMQDAITRLVQTGQHDIVIVESSQMAGFDFGGARVILDEHNIEYELLERTWRTERSPLRRLYNLSEYLKFRREEIATWRKVDACLVTSEREQDVIHRHVPARECIVVPNGVDLDYFNSQPDTSPNDGGIVFTGRIDYRPNTDAVTWFVTKVLPHVLTKYPTAVFTIVGQGVPDEVRALSGPHVRVTGRVDDIRPYVLGAAVVVVPIRIGSGTRLKVLEGMAMGKAMVSTTVGCEGLDVTAGKHLIVADKAQDFAGAVVRLLDDDAERASLGRAARELVQERYGWGSVARELYPYLLTVTEEAATIRLDHVNSGV